MHSYVTLENFSLSLFDESTNAHVVTSSEKRRDGKAVQHRRSMRMSLRQHEKSNSVNISALMKIKQKTKENHSARENNIALMLCSVCFQNFIATIKRRDSRQQQQV
jgi:hypothetical protein